jgi:lipoprotein-anchoring transpeptidase ErfK/SrfK
VALESRPAGEAGWTALGAVSAGPDGAFSFAAVPSVTTDYRVVFAGDDTHAAAAVELQVLVRPRVSVRFPTGLWLGETGRIRGSVAPAHPAGTTVLIEHRVDGVWTPLTSATLDGDSRFSLPWTPSSFGFYRLRARLEADADHASGTSVSVRVVVNRPNQHNVPYKYAHYIVIVVHEYRLYYYEHGAKVRTFRVALGRPGYPTPIGLYRIYHKALWPGGALGARVMYYLRSIAIHGTNEPWLLSRFPRPFSHGCARMYNRDVVWLYERCPWGTPVRNLL